jgi:hypothetical protein
MTLTGSAGSGVSSRPLIQSLARDWSDIPKAAYAPEDFYRWTAAYLDKIDTPQLSKLRFAAVELVAIATPDSLDRVRLGPESTSRLLGISIASAACVAAADYCSDLAIRPSPGQAPRPSVGAARVAGVGQGVGSSAP